ncbi:MAG: C4-type zinc ribbon domain-containing protein [Clostridia bacterium]|nr:C4-type zinc ribbon domain-containing protein [Clostridia bacterium]
MQLDALWQFMQVDMEADGFEGKMRQSENRQKLLKYRNVLMEQKNSMKKLEDDIAGMSDRLEAIADEIARLEKKLEAAVAEKEAHPATTIEEAAKQADVIEKLLKDLADYEKEMQKMHRDSENRDKQQKDIRVRAAKAKAEYDALKVTYDKEFGEDSETLNKLREKSATEAKKVDPTLLARYREIKQHCTPPMAKLMSNQCGQCFMEQPSATLLSLKGGDTIVECNSCGRILYAPANEG